MDAIVNLLPKPWQPYAKSVVAALGTVVMVLVMVFPDNAPRWVSVVIAVATTLGVYGVPNKPAEPVE